MAGKPVESLTDDPGGTVPSPVGIEIEEALAEVLADVAHVPHVPPEAHFFTDLGADSLVMAHFCARIRKRDDLPPVSIKDVYRNPSIRALAAAVAEPRPALPEPAPAALSEAPAPAASSFRYAVFGIAQMLVFIGWSTGAGFAADLGYSWVSEGSGLLSTYVRSAVFGAVAFLFLCIFPVAAKWILVGRWKAGEFPLWSLSHLRLWTVKALLHANPMLLLVGNPLYVLYLRALGARIGKGAVILTRSLPVCTDLLTVGAGAVVRKDSLLLCYRAQAGRIQTGPVTLGREVFVGEHTVLDIHTSMGDGAQLGHSSALHSGTAVPAGQSWHGSPAQPTEVNHQTVPPARCGTVRRTVFGLVTLVRILVIYVPLAVGGVYLVFTAVPPLASRLEAPRALSLGSSGLYIDALGLSLVLFLGFLLLGPITLFTLPRLLSLGVRPDRVYPLYGFHYELQRAISRMTNLHFFTWLLGDSSYIVHYLRRLGYDLSQVEQTGSNFGTQVQHESPFLSSVGSGTMIADGLSLLNAEFSSTSFRVTRTAIGAHNFLGNRVAYPPRGRTGENCLLATKVMVPLDGEVREGVGLLGSPPFEIPRTVERDSRFDHLRSGEEMGRRLAAKNRYNLRSMALLLVLRWLHFFVFALFGLAVFDVRGAYGDLMFSLSLVLGLVFTTLYFVLAERTVTRFRPLQPRICSIYDPYFWWHERLWKVPEKYLEVFNGTPFKSLVWRLLGVRIGRRVFDDGCFLSERTLAAIGDDCTLNAGSVIQCHSQEDGTFKSDHSTLGAGCTLGVGAFVHYGVRMGDGAVLDADSFLMKGEEVPQHALWRGNPATAVR